MSQFNILPAMKKTTKLNKILGLTQNDTAMLMGITRTQWSMFESGKRALPLRAKILLGEIIKHLNHFDPRAFERQQQEAVQNKLQKLLHENEFKRYQTDQKIASTTRKLNAALALEKLMDFVKKTPVENLPFPEFKSFLPERKKTNEISALTEQLTEHQHQKELLEYEMKLILTKLKK